MTRLAREVALFVVIMIAAGWIGVWLNIAMGTGDTTQGLGTLLWLLAPAIAALVFALRGGDWVQNLGLGFGRAGRGVWYALAVLITPIIVMLLVPLAMLTGAITINGQATSGMAALAAGFLVSSAIKNVVEELCWRGFLTHWLEGTRLAGLPNHLLTGVIWAVWHIPYWLFFISAAEIVGFSGVSVGSFILLAFVMLPLQAIFYGELRLVTGSIWPSWALHTVSNVISLLLLTGGLVTLNGAWGFVFSPGTGGLLHSVILAVLGVAIYRWRKGVFSAADLGGAT